VTKFSNKLIRNATNW